MTPDEYLKEVLAFQALGDDSDEVKALQKHRVHSYSPPGDSRSRRGGGRFASRRRPVTGATHLRARTAGSSNSVDCPRGLIHNQANM